LARRFAELPTFRSLIFASSVTLCGLASGGCATDTSSREESAALRRDLVQLAQREAALEQKIEEMDGRLLVLSRKNSPGPRSETTPPPGAPPPSMPVVRLSPTHSLVKAPPLPTEVSLKEPTADEVDALESAAPAKAPPDELVDTAPFEDGVRAVSTGDLERGIAQLEAFVQANPRHSKADNALLVIGIARLQSGDAPAALPYLNRVLHDYPAGDAVPEALLRLGECQLKLKNVPAARAALARLISEFPGSPTAKQGESRLAALGKSGPSRQPRAARSSPWRIE
jgi:TolA-binding protein